MGILSAIKRRLTRRSDDYDDEVKGAVLDQPFPAPSLEQTRFDENRFGTPAFKEPFQREPGFPDLKQAEPLTFGREGAEPSEDFRKNYDIMDKLNLMEAQLAAVRAQTEAINERLKNIEARLVRRY